MTRHALTLENLPRVIIELYERIHVMEEALKEGIGNRPATEISPVGITFTVNQLADYLKCKPQTIYKKIKSGDLPYSRVGKRVYFKKEEIDATTQVVKPKFVKTYS